MAAINGGGDWLTLPEEDLLAEEELRLAVVLNGGVSLAVWMGGVVLEVQRLTRRDSVYGRLLSALNCRARVDVIAGTSAGGINGGALAVSQVYRRADVAALRDVWAREGSLYDLLQDPWTGQPASLLRGDAGFLPALRAAFATLVGHAGPQGSGAYSPDDRPIRLRLTATLLKAEARTVTDALGAAVTQPSHAGQLTFRRTPMRLEDRDDFAPGEAGLADRLALAARTTASFPVAFEPVLLPIGESTDDAHPDMERHANFKQTRWAVDGGVLMNTPLRPVLEDIQAAPASLQVRRALLLVVPDPFTPSQAEREPDKQAERPSVADTLNRILNSVASQTVAEELRLLEEHNMRAVARRESRTDLLTTVVSLGETARALFPTYRDIRIRRAAQTIAERAVEGTGSKVRSPGGALRQPVSEVARELRRLLRERPDLPFVPHDLDDGLLGALGSTDVVPGGAGHPAMGEPGRDVGKTPAAVAFDEGRPGPPPTAGNEPPTRTAPDWGWGLATLERLAIAVQDLLKRAVWALPPGPARTGAATLRTRHSVASAALLALRRADTNYWQQWGDELGAKPLAEALNTRLDGWAAHLQAQVPGITMGGIAAELVDIGHAAARLVTVSPPQSDPLLEVDRLSVLQGVFAPDEGADRMLEVLGLEVCYLSLVETDDATASEQVIELVRISADVDQPFSPVLRASQRVAGLRLGHFAAFLKQTWRINDWIWGRLDAANRLVTLLVDPARLRRLVLLAERYGDGPGLPPAEEGGRYVGSATARRLLEQILGAPLAPGQWEDVLRVLDGQIPLSQGAGVVQPLINQLIIELAEEIVHAEEPALRTAVQADALAGENPSSAGARWLRTRYPADTAAPTGITRPFEGGGPGGADTTPDRAGPTPGGVGSAPAGSPSAESPPPPAPEPAPPPDDPPDRSEAT